MRRPSSGARAATRRAFLERAARIFEVTQREAEELVSGEPKSSVRFNRLRAEPAQTLARLRDAGCRLDPVPWCPDAHHLLSDKATVVASEEFRTGGLYLQKASSLLPPLALSPQPGQAVLDVAAAPGGKAAHIAAATGNGIDLWLNDPIAPRARKLVTMMQTYGVRYTHLTQHPGQYIDKNIEASFDSILVDAQCSGEGMLDLSHPGALRYWSLPRVNKYRRLQQRILVASFKLLRPGGVLVYSTCTFGPEENEHPVDHLLRHRRDVDVLPIEVDIVGRRPALRSWEGHRFDQRLAEAVRIVPSEHHEGFFVCKLTKT